ncbi:MAG: type II secretion system F family protein [Verrucomicrobiales bacterium]
MAVFLYSALKSDGSTASGELTASDRPEAMMRLGRQGMKPISISLKADKGGAVKETKVKSKNGSKSLPAKIGADGKPVAEDSMPDGPVKLKRAQIVIFTEELSDLLNAGLQLEPALRVMESREELSGVKDVTRILRQEVRDGSSFSAALKKASPSFSELYRSLSQAGEISGALGTILKRQAHYLVTMQELQSKVMFAMIYPAFLFMAGVAVGLLFVVYLIPKLTMLLDSTGADMPAVAKLMIDFSAFVKSYWWLFLLLLVTGIIGFRAYISAEKNRPAWDEFKLKIPFVGGILCSRFYVQMLETLANLVGNGLPLLRALELSRNATQNLFLRKKMEEVIDLVGEGGALSRSLKRVGFFPPLLIDMVGVGEQTGDIATSLEKAAERYDKELGRKIEALSALIQPVIVVVMAVIVGIMAYMMITVIFDTIGGMEGGR